MQTPFEGIIFAALFVGGLALYATPAIIASSRGKVGAIWVVVVNLLFGWTGIVWLFCLVWACTGRTEADLQLEAQRHQEMLAVIARS